MKTCIQCGSLEPYKNNYCRKCGSILSISQKSIKRHYPALETIGMIYLFFGFVIAFGGITGGIIWASDKNPLQGVIVITVTILISLTLLASGEFIKLFVDISTDIQNISRILEGRS